MQYLSAGSGIVHSEMNDQDETTRFLQVWLTPDKRGVKPQVGLSELHPAFQHPQDVTWQSNEPAFRFVVAASVGADASITAAALIENRLLFQLTSSLPVWRVQ